MSTLMRFLYLLSHFNFIATLNDEHIKYIKIDLKIAKSNDKLDKTNSVVISNEFIPEMCVQIDKYINNCVFKSNQKIAYLITQIVNKRKISTILENDILIFVCRPINIQTDGTNLIQKNLSWTEKLLRLFLYYAYDFFCDIELYIFTKEKNSSFYVNMDKGFFCLLQNIIYQEYTFKLIKKIYQYFLKENITLVHLINIAKNDILCGEIQFNKILGFFLNEIYKIIVCDIFYNEILNFKTENEVKKVNVMSQIKITLDNHPYYSILWRDITKPTCFASYELNKISNIDSLSFTINFVNKLFKESISHNRSIVIIFDVAILKIIIILFLSLTQITKKKHIEIANFSKQVKLDMFLCLYGLNESIRTLAASLCSLETILIERTTRHISKTNQKYGYLFLYIVSINYNHGVKESCENLFTAHYKKFKDEYKYKKQFLELTENFYSKYKNLIRNSFMSINEKFCGYLEISESECLNSKIENEFPSNLFTQKEYLVQDPKTQEEFERLILNDQKEWYANCSKEVQIMLSKNHKLLNKNLHLAVKGKK